MESKHLDKFIFDKEQRYEKRDIRVERVNKIYSNYSFKINGYIPVIQTKSPYDYDWLY
jgi:hypothetical protein